MCFQVSKCRLPLKEGRCDSCETEPETAAVQKMEHKQRLANLIHTYTTYTHTYIYIHLKNKMEGFTRFQRNKNRGRYRFWGGSHSQEQGYWPPFKGRSSDDKFSPYSTHMATCRCVFFSGSDPSKPHAAERDWSWVFLKSRRCFQSLYLFKGNFERNHIFQPQI